MKKTYYSNGKLLITGEYLVLKGALAFALPVNKGQRTDITCGKNVGQISWNSFFGNENWFGAQLTINDLEIISTSDFERAGYVQRLLKILKELNPGFLADQESLEVNNYLDFHPDWGFGSSSTLISNLSEFAGVDPYEVNKIISGGSGFDIACARSNSPILYQNKDGERNVTEVSFNPNFKENLYFIWLGNKKSTAQSIRWFEENIHVSDRHISEISLISEGISLANELNGFSDLLKKHTVILEEVLGVVGVQKQYFNDFDGVIKPLGAWGGDFVLAVSEQDKGYVNGYFKNKGLDTVLGFASLMIGNE